jgi:hypothetical protein
MVSSKTAITSTVKSLTKVENKTARIVATQIQTAQKTVAKEVKVANQTVVKKATAVTLNKKIDETR